MMDPSLAFLQQHFRSYYRRNPVSYPQRFTSREWGFIFFSGGFMQRHLGFRTQDEVRDFFLRRPPAHAYYSTAYYERPSAPTMPEKGWRGADLIFDLDADHLAGADGLTFEKMLELVRDQVINLVDDFLRSDFGFTTDQMELYFSGGRGYHVHVHDPKIYDLSAHDRREIVDYITGTGFDININLRRSAIKKERVGKWTKLKYAYDPLPPPTAPGWRARIRRGLEMQLEEWETLPEERAIKSMTQYKGIGKKGAKKLYQSLYAGSGEKRQVEKFRETGRLDYLTEDDRLLNAFVTKATDEMRVLVEGETDEPVTADIKRLIRVPGSLHGKTGFCVTPVPFEEMDTFEPLLEAVVFSQRPMKVRVVKPFAITLCDERYSYEPDEAPQSMPECVAIYAVAKRFAII